MTYSTTEQKKQEPQEVLEAKAEDLKFVQAILKIQDRREEKDLSKYKDFGQMSLAKLKEKERQEKDQKCINRSLVCMGLFAVVTPMILWVNRNLSDSIPNTP